jgi:hypothetical protein
MKNPRGRPNFTSARRYIALTVIALVFFTLLLSCLEFRYRRSGMIPGQLYPAFHVTGTLVNEQMLRSDEAGMNYLDSSYHFNDTLHHVNKQGFLSEFDYTQRVVDSFHACGKKIVFLIGDSYVAGVSTTTFDKTFGQLLQHNTGNYVIFNFGIPGTDPLQYELVTRKFMDLAPDLLIVAFCGANDIMQYDHAATPGIPYYYQTNAGWLSSVVPAPDKTGPNQIFHTSAQAYQYYLGTTTLHTRTGLFARVCKHLNVSTQLYFLLFPGFPEGNYKPRFDCGASYKYLHRIDSLCKTRHFLFEIVVTPDPDKALLKSLKSREDCITIYAAVFRDLMPVTHFATGFDFKDDFKATDKRHFSDEGNKKFAGFVDKIITSKLSP